MSKAGETVLERAASSSRTDAYAALVALVVVIAQLVGLQMGTDLLKFINAEWVIGLFGIIAYARRKLVNGRGVRAVTQAREDSYDNLPVPVMVTDEVTAPLDVPPHLKQQLEDEKDE